MSETDYPNEVSLGLIEHLRELYHRLIISVLCLLLLTVIGFFFSEKMFILLMNALPEGVAQKNFSLFGPFMMRLKLSFYFGLFFSLPILAYQGYAFVKPALKLKENKFAMMFLFGGWLLLLTAITFTYQALSFFVESLLSWSPEGVVNEAEITHFISDFLTIYLGFAILFQIPLVIFLLIGQGLISAKTFKENRRWVVVILLILCALFTPPDPISQIAVFIPIYALFELAIFLGAWYRN